MTRIPRTTFETIDKVVLYMQKKKFTPKEIKAWRDFYKIKKVKQYYATDVKNYIITLPKSWKYAFGRKLKDVV
jgi:hypothetical protein